MNNKGVILIFTLIVLLVLSVILGGFFVATVNNSIWTRKYIERMRAFWLAEAGIAKAMDVLHNVNETVEGYGDYDVTVGELPSINTIVNNTTVTYYFYNITSTGYAGSSSRQLNTIVRRTIEKNTNSNFFPYSLESTVDIEVKGSVDITGDNGCTSCSGNSCSCLAPQCCKENSFLNFPALFGVNKVDLEAYAETTGKKYTPSTLPDEVSGLVWVEGDLNIASNQNLSTKAGETAILIVEGNAHFSGNINFNGIIYVIGELTITGTVKINGSVLAESKAHTDTDIKGNVALNRNETIIQNALDSALPATETERVVVGWREL